MYLYKIILPPSNADLKSSHKAGFLHYALIIAAVAFLLFGLLNLGWDWISKRNYRGGNTLSGKSIRIN